MKDIEERLREYRAYNPNTDRDDHPICNEAAEEIHALRKLVKVLVDNEPNDLIANGGATVLDMWRAEAFCHLPPAKQHKD